MGIKKRIKERFIKTKSMCAHKWLDGKLEQHCTEGCFNTKPLESKASKPVVYGEKV